MKLRFSISLKLLFFILPLVCLPIAVVGYFSIQASVERVDRLVRHEQMVEVKATAQKINDVLYYCRLDLETISRLPVLEDYHNARSFRLEAEAEFHHENIVKLFRDFIGRTTYYYRIRCLDAEARELVNVRRDMDSPEADPARLEELLQSARASPGADLHMSEITYSPTRQGYLMHFMRPYFSGWGELSGFVVIELDFQMIMAVVKAIQVGERGYAFLIDQSGRNIAHPYFEPYRYHLGNYPDDRLRNLVLEMMDGGVGWRQYRFEGEDKVAAFSFIPATQWSLAVTIPSGELRREALAIRTRVIQAVLVSLFFAVIGVGILSYYLLRPVRNLVTATSRMAHGDMSQELPVQSSDELGDLTQSFNRMVKNLARIQNELVRSEKLISLGRLSAGVAHEIRNPLNAMKGAVVYMQRRRADDSLVQEYTHLVSEEIDRLNRFVTEFLYFAKQTPLAPMPTDVNRLIQATQNLFGQQARERGVSFENHLDTDLPLIHVDPQQMEQVLMNLLINAIDAMPNGGRLITRTSMSNATENRTRATRVHIAMADTGVGVAPEHMASIFDPFFTTKETGTGLGLPLSLGIVEAHGGTLSVSSEKGAGTTVNVELPLGSEPTERKRGLEQEKNPGRR